MLSSTIMLLANRDGNQLPAEIYGAHGVPAVPIE